MLSTSWVTQYTATRRCQPAIAVRGEEGGSPGAREDEDDADAAGEDDGVGGDDGDEGERTTPPYRMATARGRRGYACVR